MFDPSDGPTPPPYDQVIDGAVRSRARQLRRHRGIATAATLVALAATLVAGGSFLRAASSGRTVQVVSPPTSQAALPLRGLRHHPATPAPVRHLETSSFDLLSRLPDYAAVIAGPYLYVQPSLTSIERLDPTSGKVLATYELTCQVTPVLTTNASLWVAGGRRIRQLDASTLAVQRTFAVPGVVSSVAVAGGYLWFTSSVTGTQPSQHLYRQPLTGAPSQTVPISGTAKDVYADQDGSELVVTQTTSILRVDPVTGTVMHIYRFGQSMNTLIGGIADSIAWIIEGGSHYNTLTGINLQTGANVPITRVTQTLPPVGGELRFTGRTVLQTGDGSGPDSCIDPTSGATRVSLLVPEGTVLVGIVDGKLFAESGVRHNQLLRTTVHGCQ